MRALISVYYKEGVEDLAKALQELGYEIVSSSSTAKYLTERGLKVKEIDRSQTFPKYSVGG
jgi:phosphoribosylaminoimidazolecarboxamide formyltransferase/IMP cyclohydrolase